MKIQERFKILYENERHRNLLIIILSIFLTLAFALYNLYLSIKYSYPFSIAITIYYLIIILIKSVSLVVERKIKNGNESLKNVVRTKNYIVSSILIFVMDLCLIAPAILMVVQPKEFAFGLIPAIVFATYAVYKIITSIINYKKSKKEKNLTIILFREINIIEAIVSILILQNILIMVNGGMNSSMRTLSFVTSIAFIILIIVFSILSFLKNKKLYREQKRE